MANEKKSDPEKRLPSAWEAREAKRRKSAAVNKIVTVVILGALVGLAVVRRDDIARIYNEMTRTATQRISQAAPSPVPPVIEMPPEHIQPVEKPPEPQKALPPPSKVEPVPPEPPVLAADEQAARKLIDEGKKLLDDFGYAKAASSFNDAAKKQAGKGLLAEARNWAQKSEAFENATKHIPFAEYATVETAYIIQTYQDGEWRGLRRSENDEQILLQAVSPENPAAQGKTSLPIQRDQITKIIPITLAQRKSEFEKLIVGVEQSQAFQKSTDFYDLVYLSRRLSMGHHCLGYLLRAYDGEPGHAPDRYLGDSFRKVVIRRAIERASLLCAAGRKQFANDEINRLLKTLPGYQVAIDEADSFRLQVLDKLTDRFVSTIKIQDASATVVAQSTTQSAAIPVASTASKSMDEDVHDFKVDSRTVLGNGAAGPIVERANAKYEEGMRLWRGYRQGTTGNNNRNLEGAETSLNEAVNLYDEALKLDPGNKTVTDRQLEASMIVYACHKYKTL